MVVALNVVLCLGIVAVLVAMHAHSIKKERQVHGAEGTGRVMAGSTPVTRTEAPRQPQHARQPQRARQAQPARQSQQARRPYPARG